MRFFDSFATSFLTRYGVFPAVDIKPTVGTLLAVGDLFSVGAERVQGEASPCVPRIISADQQ